MKKARPKIPVLSGSGNVFADLDLPDAAERLAKAQLAVRIINLIDDAGLSQANAARRLGVDQPKISALKRGQLSGFSTDRLLRFLIALGQDVEITIKPRSSRMTRRQPISVRSVA